MENHQIWNLVQSAYNLVDFKNQFYDNNINIESNDNWYRVDIIDGWNSISVTVEKNYSIVNSESTYSLKILQNGHQIRQTQKELMDKIIEEHILPKLRNIRLKHFISE
jgi:hypothetical protein